MAPFINDYEEHFQYCTYDVTDLLQRDNEISFFWATAGIVVILVWEARPITNVLWR